jgi:hypothetical protein
MKTNLLKSLAIIGVVVVGSALLGSSIANANLLHELDKFETPSDQGATKVLTPDGERKLAPLRKALMS